MESMKRLSERIRLYVQVTHIDDIARRYFVKNGMDGSMTVLGIILGSWAAKVEEPHIIVLAGLGACLAMGVSGIFGAYVTEKAEQRRKLRTLEDSMLSDLNGSLHQDASNIVPALAALVDGLSPTLTATVSLVPFFMSMNNLLSIWDGYTISVILTFLTLFALGLYLGSIAKEKIFIYGLQTLAAGIMISIIIFLFGRFE